MKSKRPRKEKQVALSVVIPMRNASTTVLETLKSITKQDYPIKEIIVVDNVSKDSSREIVLTFAKKSKIPIRLLRQTKDKGVSSSCNWGIKEAKSDLVVLLASDCSLPSNHELERLMQPFRNDSAVVAAYSQNTIPAHVWDTYNFWQKFHSARDIDNFNSLMVLKFDCVRRSTFLKIGGFDEINFGGEGSMGGEDADISDRLIKEGKVIKSEAISYHLHYMGKDFSVKNIMYTRKMSARSYARFIRKNFFVSPIPALTLLIRPALSILPFILSFHTISVIPLIFYTFLYSKKMFITKSTLLDLRIVLIPFLNILFLYYELFWMLEAFLTYKKSLANR